MQHVATKLQRTEDCLLSAGPGRSILGTTQRTAYE